MNVVFVANGAYAMPLAVTARSLLESLDRATTAEITVLHTDDFTPELRARVERSQRGLAVSWRWRQVDASPYRRLPGSAPPYFKFLLGETLEEKRALLLDCDLLVERDLTELWNTPLAGKSLLAVTDQAIPTFGSPGAPPLAMDVPRATPYFNSGVMLVNLTRWRKEEAHRRLLAVSERWRNKLRYQDQDGFNAVFKSRWGMLPGHWNRIYSLSNRYFQWPRKESNERAIYHFAGAFKPWLLRTGCEIEQRYYATLDRTAWRGWRPAPSPAARLKVAYLRHLRRHVYCGEAQLFQFLRERVGN